MSEPPATIGLLLSRRSIREGYRAEPVPRDTVQEIVRCGLAAPSSKNAQPWCFHIVDNLSLLAELANLMDNAADASSYVPHDPMTGEPRARYTSTVSDSAELLRSVPVAVFIENIGPFSDGRRTLAAAPRSGLPAALEGYALEVLGIGAAMQSMWTAAIAYGLAGAFIGDVGIVGDAIAERLRITGDLVGALVVGWSDALPRLPMDTAALPETTRAIWHSR